MPAEVVTYMFSSLGLKEHLQFQMVLQCAPFLKGIKAACATNIEERYCPELAEVLADTGIEYRYLAMDKGRRLVFFYRRKGFSRYLKKRDIGEFLENYGYPCREPERALDRLSERVCQYTCGNAGFPHEIGAFLGYPVNDVRCFIERKGQGGFMTGYWKVYHNPGKAQLIFQAYDKARISAVNEFLAGASIRDISEDVMASDSLLKEDGGESYELC